MMNFGATAPSGRAVKAAAALSMMLFGSAASATTGGSEYAGGFCLEPGGKRVLYGRGDSSEAGNGTTIIAIELATGKSTQLVSGENYEEAELAGPKAMEGCTPLVAAKLAELGIQATTRTPRGGNEHAFDGKTLPQAEMFSRLMHPQILSLKSGIKTLASEPFGVCYLSTSPAVATAFIAPGKTFALVAFTFRGLCYEGGYDAVKIFFLPNAVRSDAVKKLATRKPGEEVFTSIPIEAPTVKLDRLLNDAGMALYRAGLPVEAAAYFEAAYLHSKSGKTPYLLAQFNRAAALATAGETEGALHEVAVLLSYRSEREKYRAKVRKDPDFKTLLGDDRLRALLADDDCCLERVDETSSTDPPSRSRTEWRLQEGESVMSHYEAWRHGTKVLEQTTAGSKQWNDYGVLIEKAFILPGGRIISQRWNDDGSFDSETHYLNGLIVPPPDAGTPH